MFLLLGVLLSSPVQAAAVPDMSVSAAIDAAVSMNGASADYSEWKNSGVTPEDVFREVDAQDSPAIGFELCTKLGSLSDEDLALFDHELAHSKAASKLECRPDLESRLQRYWLRMRHSLVRVHDGEVTDEAPAVIPTLPSEVRVIDAAKGPVLTDGHLAHGEIALTFDDGPHPTRTRKVLDTLAAAGIRATFFEVGEMAKRNPQLSKAVIAAGHTVGSHTWNHPQLPKLPLAQAEHNILLGHDTVMTATGIETPFFRFPYGARSSALQAFVQGLGMASFLWNMDSLDWKIRDPNALLKNVISELDRAKGGIILFHDIQEQTTIILPHFLEELKIRGFKTVVFVPAPPPPPRP